MKDKDQKCVTQTRDDLPHVLFMQRAIELAKKGAGRVNPNPMVGAVIVKEGRIIGEGYHRVFGGPHAEREALANCSESPEGATLYVTLEPCCHHGKTGPCTEAIIESGIAKVYVGTLDPNPRVSQKGVDQLRVHNICVEIGLCEETCKELIRVFSKYIATNNPYVIMKYAMTLDGKIATTHGESQWISGEASLYKVHETRNKVSAIMIGVGTLLADDPLLTCRLKAGRNPVRIVCDTSLRTPVDAKLVRTAKNIPTYIATNNGYEDLWKAYEEAGCHILWIPSYEGHIDLKVLLEKLGEMGIDSVLLEGGSHMNWSALERGLVDEIHAYIGAKIFGGLGPSPVMGRGVPNPQSAMMTRVRRLEAIGDDLYIESEVLYPCLQES